VADEDRELAQRVLGFRRAGVSFDVIADRLQLTPDRARELFDLALASFDPELSAALEADRLDRLHSAVWGAAVGGDVYAVDRILKISERRDKVTVPARNTHELRAAFDESAQTSVELNPSMDKALVEAGRKIADQVDEAVAAGNERALYLLPHLVNILREMMATPASRLAAREPGASSPREGKLAELRAIHSARSKRTG
jgi:hypothetical protein